MSAHTLKVTADPLVRPVRAFAGFDRNVTHAEGVCIGVCDSPTLVIETKDGAHLHWRADLCEVTGEELSEAELAQYRADRPTLVTIDPEDREQIKRLADAWDRQTHATLEDGEPLTMTGWRMLAALREFANPTPPKLEEPTGLGAVVEDSNGDKWVRLALSIADFDWLHADDPSRSRAWRNIAAVKVLSEGVTA